MNRFILKVLPLIARSPVVNGRFRGYFQVGNRRDFSHRLQQAEERMQPVELSSAQIEVETPVVFKQFLAVQQLSLLSLVANQVEVPAAPLFGGQ
jgi:hypothetical protein